MGPGEQILRDDQERERRYEAAKAAVASLSREERRRLLAELIRQADGEGQGRQSGGTPRAVKPAFLMGTTPVVPSAASYAMQPVADSGSFVDKAEAYILQHPGSTTAQVAEAIGQERASAAGTLRHLAASRGTVESEDGVWRPTLGGNGSPKKITNRAAIITVLAQSGPLGTNDIFHHVQKLLPDASKPSIAAEISRLNKAGAVAERGYAGRGPAYVLIDGGAR